MCKKNMMVKLPQILLGLLFVVAGVVKLFVISPANFAGMIEMSFGMIGLAGGLALAAAWVVAIIEVLGGLALILSKLIPVKITKILISLLIIVMAAAIIFVHVRGGDLMSALKDLVLLSLLVAVCKSPCCLKKACSKKKCEKETCTDGACEA